MAESQAIAHSSGTGDVTVRPIRDSDDREVLVDIMRRAYGRHLKVGLNYAAGKRGVEEFEQFVKGAVACFVAEADGRLVGTVCCGWPRGGCAWYEQPRVFTATQLAVDPECQGRGVGRLLMEAVDEKALESGAIEVAIDTACEAHDVIAFNKRLGFRHVDRLQWGNKTYESVILSKRLRSDEQVTIPTGRRVRWWLRRKRARFARMGLADLPRWFRGVRRVWWKRPRRAARSGQRQVLLVAESPMMLPYLFDIVEVLQDDERVTFHATAREARSHEATSAVMERLKERDVAFVSGASASLRDWDCVVFADHGLAHHFSPRCRKVLNWHSIDGSKFTPGTKYLYRYNPEFVLTRDGRPVYDCMFDASESSRAAAIEAVPALRDRVVVVGDRRADRLLQMEKDRQAIRRSLGIGEDEKAVLLGSTFGTESFFETIGPQVFEQAVGLKDRYRFILSGHPQLWPPHDRRSPSLGERLLEYEREHGFVVHRQPGDLFVYLAAADLLVTDFGSLVVNYALTRKPVAFVPFPEEIVSPQSFVAKIRDISPRLEQPEDLADVLARLERDYPLEQLGRIAEQIVSCPGEAETRMRRELYRLLRLEPRTEAEAGRSKATAAGSPTGGGAV